MKKDIMKKIVSTILILSIYSIVIGNVTAIEGDYLGKVIIDNPGNILKDYQIKIESEGDSLSKYEGFRLIQDNKELYYYTELSNIDLSRIWANVPKISSGTTILDLYGSHQSDSTYNNDGSKTFDFFADFGEQSIDTSRWKINNGSPTIVDGILNLNGMSIITETEKAFGYNYIFESHSMSDKNSKVFLRSTNDYTLTDGTDRFEYGSWEPGKMSLSNIKNDTPSLVTIGEEFPIDFEILGIARTKSGIYAYRNYQLKMANKNDIPDSPVYLQLYSYEGTHYVDWARVRKFADKEPTVKLELGGEVTPTVNESVIPTNVVPTVTNIPVPTTTIDDCISVTLHGEKTDVKLGENILLKLSAVNCITKPPMHVQTIIIPPSGMSVTSADFVKSPAGQYTSDFILQPGDGKDIEVKIISNQIGEFSVKGKIVYYFGDDKSGGKVQELNLPIKVRLVEDTNKDDTTRRPRFGIIIIIVAISIMATILIMKMRKK